MQTISEAQFRMMGKMYRAGCNSMERIARRAGVAKRTVEEFLNGQSRNPIGMAVFEEETRPPGISKEQHVAWLAANGYRGFSDAARVTARGCASHSETPG